MDMRDAFFDKVYDLAKEDERIVLLTGDHGAFSLLQFQKDFPERYINMGIAEQNMISVAAGLALSGKRVFVYGIVNFVTLRVLEQISVDLASMKLPVTIVGVGGGFAYSTDGPTHHGTQDISAICSIPEIEILNCSDEINTNAFATIGATADTPQYIRIEKGELPTLYDVLPEHNFSDGFASLRRGNDLTIIATGIMVHQAFKIAAYLEDQGVHCGIIDLYRIKPLPTECLMEALEGCKRAITLEESILSGGIGSIVSTALSDHGITLPLKRFGIRDQFCFDYGERTWLQKKYGLGADDIKREVIEWIK